MKVVRLGFAVGSGADVNIPLNHTIICGQTQMAGKTTALEGLIGRAQVSALAFVTKRGERAFASARRIEPFFSERADWQFVASVLESILRERLKFERAWIMRASKGAQTLADVQYNVRKALGDKKTRGLNADIYTQLDEYLNIVVPRIASVRFAPDLVLGLGVNVVDLSNPTRFPEQLQGLVIRSSLERIYQQHTGVVAIIPEAWQFVPQSRGSPVKLAAVELIRKGAALQNFVWLDSQDIGGVDKELLRSCPIWLLGVQRETNEIKRTLAAIPAGIKKPSAADIATLERGQFFACYGSTVVKTYAQPAWMSDELAQHVALGKFDQSEIAQQYDAALAQARAELDEIAALSAVDAQSGPRVQPGECCGVDAAACWAGRASAGDLNAACCDHCVHGVQLSADKFPPLVDATNALLKESVAFPPPQEDDDMTPEQADKLDQILSLMEGVASAQQARQNAPQPPPDREIGRDGIAREIVERTLGDEESLFQRFKTRLMKEAPALIKVLVLKPELHVVQRTNVIEIDGATAEGRVAMLIHAGFFDGKRRAGEVENEINKRGGNLESITVYKAVESMVERGFLWREKLSNRSVVYSAVEDAKSGIKRKSA